MLSTSLTTLDSATGRTSLSARFRDAVQFTLETSAETQTMEIAIKVQDTFLFDILTHEHESETGHFPGLRKSVVWFIHLTDDCSCSDSDSIVVYVVYEPDALEDGELETVATAEYIWNEDNSETLMVDPAGIVYLVTKVVCSSQLIWLLKTNQAIFTKNRAEEVRINAIFENLFSGG